MEKTRLLYLFIQQNSGEIQPAERQELINTLNDPGQQELVESCIQEFLEHPRTSLLLKPEKVEETLERIFRAEVTGKKTINPVYRRHFIKTAWFRYAAAFMLLVGTGSYFWLRHNRVAVVANYNKHLHTDIAPGMNGAILTLADGTQLVLDSLGNGVIATQNGAQIALKDGQLAYGTTGENNAGVIYNTMSTPKGRQFNLVLPDGTHVWLNAASSLRFPTSFNGKERRVEIRGEAYFEVANDARQPFFVKINDQADVEVLGTSFNVNSYEDEASINTTLLRGSVRVAFASSDVVLKPGQQAQISAGHKTRQGGSIQQVLKVVNKTDIEKVMAWKNGAFNFNDASLEEVMRQLERWYDIEVVYEKAVPDIHFVGEMSRDVSLNGLIRGLDGSGVRFRIEEGRRLVVMP